MKHRKVKTYAIQKLKKVNVRPKQEDNNIEDKNRDE